VSGKVKSQGNVANFIAAHSVFTIVFTTVFTTVLTTVFTTVFTTVLTTVFTTVRQSLRETWLTLLRLTLHATRGTVFCLTRKARLLNSKLNSKLKSELKSELNSKLNLVYCRL